MMDVKQKAKIDAQITRITAGYRQESAAGYKSKAVGLPTYESQEDHDLYHPDQAGSSFTEENEFSNAIGDGLRANGVPAVPILIRYKEYAEFLNGQENTTEFRAAFCGYLTSKQHATS